MVIHPKYVYKPSYTAKGWQVTTLDTAHICDIKGVRSLEHRGTLYNRDNLYLTEAGAQAWIRKDYTTASRCKYGGFVKVQPWQE